MAIKKYGLDAAEIENLKKANLTDDEINELNKKRVQEQLESNDTEPIGANEAESPNEIASMPFYGGDKFPADADINVLMPHASNAMRKFYIEHFGDFVTKEDGSQVPFLPPSYVIEMWYAKNPAAASRQDVNGSDYIFNPDVLRKKKQIGGTEDKTLEASRFIENILIDIVESLNPEAGDLVYKHNRLIKNL